jgi:hypothetical protein
MFKTVLIVEFHKNVKITAKKQNMINMFLTDITYRSSIITLFMVVINFVP